MDHSDIDHTGLTGVGAPSEITDIPTAETDDTKRLAPDGVGGVAWAAGGGGGVTHSYIGYNTVGGSTAGWTTNQARAKQVVLAADGLLTSIAFYIDQASANNIESIPIPCVWQDAAGVPSVLIFTGLSQSLVSFLGEPPGTYTYAARWLATPCGLWLPAGTYWIGGVMGTTGADIRLYYDGSGSDVTWSAGAGVFVNDGGRWTNTVTSNKYSIRGSLIT